VKLIVGLGTPGYQYELTPHNLGFRVVDQLAQDCGVEIDRPEAQALLAVVQIEGVDAVLAKPQTFMNLSGLAVARLLGKRDLPVEDLIVLVDDADLPLGSLRIRRRGTAGSHNGLKSIIGALEADEFVRVRLGIQPDHPVEDLIAYVLGRFRKADLESVAEMIERAAEAVHVILREGIQPAMSRFNRRVASQ
jgi:PTH1 family peptidyl-tRNA hydrolase